MNLKLMMLTLVIIGEDNGTGIFAGEQELGRCCSVHRVTAGQLLKDLGKLGLVHTVRRGGRWKTKDGVVGRNAIRRFDVAALQALPEAFGRSHVAAWSANHTATSLNGRGDHTATSLRLKALVRTKGPVRTRERKAISCASTPSQNDEAARASTPQGLLVNGQPIAVFDDLMSGRRSTED